MKNYFKPKKFLGQHFLKCRSAINQTVKEAEIKSDDKIIEVGPGNGILTIPLSKAAKLVIAVEKDGELAENLKKSLKEKNIENVDIITADILKIIPDLIKHYAPNAMPYKVVANIPYYITSRFLRLLFELENKPQLVILMVQKEVAKRIIADPPHNNLLALSIQAYGRPKIISKVPSSCFWPKPKVDSAIIKIGDISSDFFVKNKVDEKQFFKLVKTAFSQKRKALFF